MSDRALITEARQLAAESEWPVPDRMIRSRCAALMSVVRELADALEVAQRPLLGYVAMARPKDDSDSPYGILIGRNLATDKLAAEMQRARFQKDEDLDVVLGEIREAR